MSQLKMIGGKFMRFLKVIGVVCIIAVILGIIFTETATDVYEWMFSNTYVGKIRNVDSVVSGGIITSTASAPQVVSFGVMLDMTNGDVLSFSSTDSQFAPLRNSENKGLCAKVKVFPYAPWYWKKAGTWHDGRVLKMNADCSKLIPWWWPFFGLE